MRSTPQSHPTSGPRVEARGRDGAARVVDGAGGGDADLSSRSPVASRADTVPNTLGCSTYLGIYGQTSGMRPAIVHSVLWAAAFVTAAVVGVATFAYVQANVIRTLSPGEIQQRLAGAEAQVPAPSVPPAEPPGNGPTSPRPVGGADDPAGDKEPADRERPSPSPSPSPPPRSQTRSFGVTGGSITATCRDTSVSVDATNPADNFFTEKVTRRSASEVSVRFDELDAGKPDILVSVKCEKGVPKPTQTLVDDDDT